MELNITRDNILDIDDNIKNAITTVKETFDNSLQKGLDKLNLENGIVSKVKSGLKEFDVKEVAADTIDTALKSTLKGIAGIKARTVDNIQDLGKAIRDSNLKGGLKSILNIGIDSIKELPTSIKNVVKDGVDLILG